MALLYLLIRESERAYGDARGRWEIIVVDDASPDDDIDSSELGLRTPTPKRPMPSTRTPQQSSVRLSTPASPRDGDHGPWTMHAEAAWLPSGM